MRRSLSTTLRGARRRIGIFRAQTLGKIHPELSVGRGVVIGRRCRLTLEPDAELTLGPGCEIDDGVTLHAAAGARLSIGEGAFVGHTCTIAARESVRIGRRVFLAELVSVRDHDHDPSDPPSCGTMLIAPVSIGDDCWLASKVTVVRGVSIGERTVVGAHAVVTKDLPPGVVAVGTPAAVVREKHERRA